MTQKNKSLAIHIVIPAMRKPRRVDQEEWEEAVIECCQAFLSLGVAQLSLVARKSFRDVISGLERHPEFEFFELDYEPQGALATVCIALASRDSRELAIGICPSDTLISESVGQAIHAFGLSDSKCLVLAFAIPRESADKSWSYVHMVGDSTPRIAMIAEGSPPSPIATSGIFLFRDSKTFLSAAEWCFVNQTTTSGSYFTSSAVNYLITEGEKVDIKTLDPGDFEKRGRESFGR